MSSDTSSRFDLSRRGFLKATAGTVASTIYKPPLHPLLGNSPLIDLHEDLFAHITESIWGIYHHYAVQNPGAHMIHLLNIDGFDGLWQHPDCHDTIDHFNTYGINLANLTHPSIRTELDQYVQSIIEKHNEQVSHIAPLHAHDKRKKLMTLPVDIGLSGGKSILTSLLGQIQGGRETPPELHNIHLDEQDVHFAIERYFLETYGFQANHFDLPSDYKNYLDWLARHPVIRLAQIYNYESDSPDMLGHSAFNKQMPQIRTITESEETDFDALYEYMRTQMPHSLTVDHRFLAETQDKSIENLHRAFEGITQEYRQNCSENHIFKLSPVGHNTPDNGQALYKAQTIWFETADDDDIQVTQERDILLNAVKYQFSAAVKALVIHEQLLIHVGWNATDADLRKIDSYMAPNP